MWRNGRRACLRGKWETVWVQVPPFAPIKKSTGKPRGFLLIYKSLLCNALAVKSQGSTRKACVLALASTKCDSTSSVSVILQY